MYWYFIYKREADYTLWIDNSSSFFFVTCEQIFVKEVTIKFMLV